jgi:hypothetical protein
VLLYGQQKSEKEMSSCHIVTARRPAPVMVVGEVAPTSAGWPALKLTCPAWACARARRGCYAGDRARALRRKRVHVPISLLFYPDLNSRLIVKNFYDPGRGSHGM